EAQGNGQQTGEVVVDHQQDASQAAFDQAAQDVFPLLEVLASEAEEAGQDALLAVAAEAHDQVDRGRPEPVPLFDLDVLGIEKEGQQVGIERARVAQLQLFEEFSGDGFQVLFGSGQTDAAEGRLSGVERAAGSQQGEQQDLGLLGVIALIGRRQKGGAKAARARARDLDLYRDGAQLQGTRVRAIDLNGVRASQISL